MNEAVAGLYPGRATRLGRRHPRQHGAGRRRFHDRRGCEALRRVGLQARHARLCPGGTVAAGVVRLALPARRLRARQPQAVAARRAPHAGGLGAALAGAFGIGRLFHGRAEAVAGMGAVGGGVSGEVGCVGVGRDHDGDLGAGDAVAAAPGPAPDLIRGRLRVVDGRGEHGALGVDGQMWMSRWSWWAGLGCRGSGLSCATLVWCYVMLCQVTMAPGRRSYQAAVVGQFERYLQTRSSGSRIAWAEQPESTHCGHSLEAPVGGCSDHDQGSDFVVGSGHTFREPQPLERAGPSGVSEGLELYCSAPRNLKHEQVIRCPWQ